MSQLEPITGRVELTFLLVKINEYVQFELNESKISGSS